MSFTQAPQSNGQNYMTVTDPVTGQTSVVPAVAANVNNGTEFQGANISAPQPRYANDIGAMHGQDLPPVQIVSSMQPGQFVPASEVEARLAAAREEEKTKLYGRMEALQSQVATLAQEQEARLNAERAAEAAELESRRMSEEAEMSAKDLAETVRRESQESIARLEQQVATERALREKDASLVQLQAYTRELLSQYGDRVLPELWDLIDGNTPEEIEQSLQEMIQRTDSVMNGVQQQFVGAAPVVQQPQLSDMRGVAPTGAAPVGPLEQGQAFQQLTPGAIRDMSMAEYRQNRDRLIQAATQTYYQG